jgi:hypothetical protein
MIDPFVLEANNNSKSTSDATSTATGGLGVLSTHAQAHHVTQTTVGAAQRREEKNGEETVSEAHSERIDTGGYTRENKCFESGRHEQTHTYI